jgi:hypothetical protein
MQQTIQLVTFVPRHVAVLHVMTLAVERLFRSLTA